VVWGCEEVEVWGWGLGYGLDVDLGLVSCIWIVNWRLSASSYCIGPQGILNEGFSGFGSVSYR